MSRRDVTDTVAAVLMEVWIIAMIFSFFTLAIYGAAL